MPKILHAADIHLDSPLRGLERYEGAPVETVRGATRRALENLVSHALAEGVELVLLAGDLFDGAWRDVNTGLFFVAQMKRLTQGGIRVVLVRGNHDAASLVTKMLPLPEGVFDLGTGKPKTEIFESLGIAVHGQGYAKPVVDENLAASYPDPLPGLLNVGILHTALDGREGHAPYAPCSVANLTSRGYDYWALGHVHGREVVSTDPWIVFPGNLQGRHARETGPKGATIVEARDGAIVSVEAVPLDVVRWAVCEVDASACGDAHEVVERVRARLEEEIGDAGDCVLAARVRVTGTSVANRALLADSDEWRDHIRAAALDVGGDVWVEKVLFETSDPVDPDTLLARGDVAGGVLRAIRELGASEELPPELAVILGSLDDKLRASGRTHGGDLTKNGAAIFREVERLLLPRLAALSEASS